MLKWLYSCNRCGVEAPPVPCLELPKGWVHRVIVDRAQPDAHGGGGGSIERHQHYCPSCKLDVLQAPDEHQAAPLPPPSKRARAGGVVGRPGSGARSALLSPPTAVEASPAPPRAGLDSSPPPSGGVVSEDASDQGFGAPHEARRAVGAFW
jgi:hypothetical protein